VLGLADEVASDDLGVGAGIGDDRHLGRAGEHVDADLAEQHALLATNLFPRPTMISAGFWLNNPNASAAIACTPPSVMMTSAPATFMA
jgi:hypothetical protein